MTFPTPASSVRTRQILEDLEAVRENLLALSDDIWRSIDHNDPEALDEGVEFKRAYNARAADFDRVATEISVLIQQYTSIRLEEAEESGADNQERNERLIAELNREEPHRLSESFTYKRPHGYVLDGQAATGITTWQRMYELVCRQLIIRDLERFRGLTSDPNFISSRGHHTVAAEPDNLRKRCSTWAMASSWKAICPPMASATCCADFSQRLKCLSTECRFSSVRTGTPGGMEMAHKRMEPSASQRSDAEGHSAGVKVWTIRHGELDLHGMGDQTILDRPCLGLICSVKCPGSVVIKTFDAIRELRDAGIVVAGGFHSPMEKECLEFLLRGEQPVILCLAKGLGGRIPTSWRTAIDADRLLFVSPFEAGTKRITKANAQARNEFVGGLSTAVLIPTASPGGNAEAAARRVLERGQPLFTFDDDANSNLLRLGARPYGIDDIERSGVSRAAKG